MELIEDRFEGISNTPGWDQTLRGISNTPGWDQTLRVMVTVTVTVTVTVRFTVTVTVRFRVGVRVSRPCRLGSDASGYQCLPGR